MCVALCWVRCSVLRHVAVRCSVLQCAVQCCTACCNMLQRIWHKQSLLYQRNQKRNWSVCVCVWVYVSMRFWLCVCVCAGKTNFVLRIQCCVCVLDAHFWHTCMSHIYTSICMCTSLICMCVHTYIQTTKRWKNYEYSPMYGCLVRTIGKRVYHTSDRACISICVMACMRVHIYIRQKKRWENYEYSTVHGWFVRTIGSWGTGDTQFRDPCGVHVCVCI